MHLDDRLATVLRHRAGGARAAATQFRQLLDLLGSRRIGRDESLLAAAWLRLAALGETIPASQRAAMIREPGLRFRNPELALHLAEDEPEVAAAALAVANLDVEDWDALIPRLPIRARGFLRLRRDLPTPTQELLERLGVHDRGLPRPATIADIVEEPVSAPAVPRRPIPANDMAEDYERQPAAAAATQAGHAEDDTEIGALVRRIEAFRRTRGARGMEESPRLPLDETAGESRPRLAAVSFTTDAIGRFDWADGAAGPMLVGGLVEAIAAAARTRAPIDGTEIVLDGAPQAAGPWVVNATPRFTTIGGRFTGYAGRLRRPVSSVEAPAPVVPAADRMRQLLHELKTPVNAIQGFAEVIQQQLFGPTPHEYRALAAGIAGDAARILAGFDELDRLARLETGALSLDPGECDLSAIVGGLAAQLNEVLAPRESRFVLDTLDSQCSVGFDRHEIEGLGWRVLATLTGAVGSGEELGLAFACDGRAATLACTLPSSFAALDDVFDSNGRAGGGGLSAGMFGAGFALRLARAEARAAGGDLVRDGDVLVLSLPRLTTAGSATSAAQVDAATG